MKKCKKNYVFLELVCNYFTLKENTFISIFNLYRKILFMIYSSLSLDKLANSCFIETLGQPLRLKATAVV